MLGMALKIERNKRNSLVYEMFVIASAVTCSITDQTREGSHSKMLAGQTGQETAREGQSQRCLHPIVTGEQLGPQSAPVALLQAADDKQY